MDFDYGDNYSDWLWKILVVTDESQSAEEYANTAVSLLGTLKDPPDVESYSIYEKMPAGKCRRVLFIFDESKRTTEENKAVGKWLRALEIDPRKSEKYMVLLISSTNENESFERPFEELAEDQIMRAKVRLDIYAWWPKVIRFLCKTRNWDNSAYMLLHAGFGRDIHDSKRMTRHIEKLEEQKKIIEIMLGQFGPRNLHKAHWNDGIVRSRPVTATDVELSGVGMVNTAPDYPKNMVVPNGYTSQAPTDSKQHTTRIGDSRTTEENHRIEDFTANYIAEEPLKPLWADRKTFAAVVPIFIVMKPDITVAEKCCLTDYAREFPKTHFLCVSEKPPSEYIRLVSRNVYGTKDLMTFIFNVLRELKVISSIRSKSKDSCVCTVI